MDQYLSTVIIAVITGIFSIITLIIQKKQDKVISKIDEQTTFIDREKALKQKLAQKEKERERIIEEIMVLTLDTNLCILENTNIGDQEQPIDDILDHSNTLKKEFEIISKEIAEIDKEYHLVLDITTEFQKEFDQNNK